MDNLNFAHGGNVYEVKREYKKDVIDFSANINPLGLPAGIKKALCKNFDKILHYPESQPKKLQRKIAQYWGISEENILLGNGSVELIYLIAHTFKPKIAAIPAPSFCEYQRAAKSVGSRIRFLKLKEREGFKLNLSHLPYADILFLCNPNNPTGNLIAENSDFIEKLSYKLNVVDEAFMDVTSRISDWNEAVNIAKKLQNKLSANIGLSSSIGVATNKMIAKIAS
ncbi:MAG: aminotransferase class I/II-fold pyridoxal phosphate-dependent enzyme, partial [Candidatus Omnitrophica bacterium]|nr:aminotransferase class I/II-fold pyridoxal phosphate-dependent enzyme [Candidatus Omnitrophota bacterium]